MIRCLHMPARRIVWPRLLKAASFAIGLVWLLAVFVTYAELTKSHFLGDAFVYLAAGERLNAGHRLYELSPTDRPVPLQPPFWTSPLVSPPPIAVLWRPLAALPNESGVLVWWLGALSCMGATIVWLAVRRPGATGVALVLLSVPMAMELGLGNVNGYLLGGIVASWVLRRHPFAGALVGTMTAIKVWPGVLLIWLMSQGNWRAVGVAAVTLTAWAMASVAGAGIDDVIAYFDVVRSVHLSAFSLSWLLGVPWLWLAALLGFAALIPAFRHSPATSFRMAVMAMVLGSPVANPNTYALLMAVLVHERARTTRSDRSVRDIGKRAASTPTPGRGEPSGTPTTPTPQRSGDQAAVSR